MIKSSSSLIAIVFTGIILINLRLINSISKLDSRNDINSGFIMMKTNNLSPSNR